MLANGNSFGISNTMQLGIQDPESSEREGLPLVWGFMDQIQKTGNAL